MAHPARAKAAQALLCAMLLPVVAMAWSLPLRGHAHNDAARGGSTRPLFTALSNSMQSIEADVHLIDGAVVLGHDLHDVDPSRTLEALYLQPLAQLVAQQGAVYPAAQLVGAPKELILLIDTNVPRGQEEEAYDAIEALLGKYQKLYPGLFTEHHPTHRVVGAVTAIMSGARPNLSYIWSKPGVITSDGHHHNSSRHPLNKDTWLLALDGRTSDLLWTENPVPLVTVMPMMSLGLCGDDDSIMPDCHYPRMLSLGDPALLARVSKLVQLMHSQGRLFRLWGYNDPGLWGLMLKLGVDLVNVEDPAQFRAWALHQMGVHPHSSHATTARLMLMLLLPSTVLVLLLSNGRVQTRLERPGHEHAQETVPTHIIFAH